MVLVFSIFGLLSDFGEGGSCINFYFKCYYYSIT